MSEIPEDVMEKATDVARRWYHEEWEPTEYIQQKLVEGIAEAILAERERCAVIRTALMSCRKRLSMQNHRLNENLIAHCDHLLGTGK